MSFLVEYWEQTFLKSIATGILLLCWQTYLAVKKMTAFHLAVSVTTARVCIVGESSKWCPLQEKLP